MKPKKHKKQSPAKPQTPGSFSVPKKINTPLSQPNLHRPTNTGWNRFGNIGRQGKN